MDPRMKHIEKFHIRPSAPIGRSYFCFTDRDMKPTEVYDLIEKTKNKPDVIEPHKDDDDKIVLKKTFEDDIGRSGRNGALCNTIFVVLRKSNNCLITAYPIMKKKMKNKV